MSAVLTFPQTNFRAMEIRDLDAVMEIEDRAYPYPWSKSIFRDCIKAGYHCWVAEQDEIVIGYTVFIVAVAECHILNICIDPKLHGEGFGRKLLKELLVYTRDMQAKCAFLEVRPSNKYAISLYESEGFNEVGIRKKYYPAKHGREDAVIFA